MKKIFNRWRSGNSIKTTFLVSLVGIILVILSVQTGISLYQMQEVIVNGAVENLTEKSKEEINKISARFDTIGKYSELMAYNISAMDKYDTELLLKMTGKYINGDSMVVGAGFWMEPFMYERDKKYYGPYLYKDDKGIMQTTWEYSTPEYDYFKYDWYKNGLSAPAGKTVWSEPYVDAVSGVSMITASAPIHKQGKVIGVTTFDVGLKELEAYIKELKVGEKGYAFILSKEGYYLGHKDAARNMKAKLADSQDAKIKSLAADITKNDKTAAVRASIEGIESFVVYAPIGVTGMSLVLVLPAAEVYGQLYKIIGFNAVLFVGAVIALIAALSAIFNRKIIKPLDELVKAADRIAQGDLKADIKVAGQDEIGILGNALKVMSENLRDIVREVAQSSEHVAASSEELMAIAEQSSQGAVQIASNITGVAEGAGRQYKAVEESSAVVTEMSAGIEQVAANTSIVASTADKTAESARKGNEAIVEVVEQMGQIEQSVVQTAAVVAKLGEKSQDIGQIVDTIANIAGQTNLLALNAAIEAARAGEQGRGFAVVAEEVRKLAEQSQEAAKQIAQMIAEIQSETGRAVSAMNEGTEQVKVGRQVVNTAGKTFEEIVTLINQVSSQTQEILSAMQEMSTGSQQIVNAVQIIDNISQEITADAESVSAAAEQQASAMEEIKTSSVALAQMAEKLQAAVNRFSI